MPLNFVTWLARAIFSNFFFIFIKFKQLFINIFPSTVAINHGEIDDNFTAMRMILAGIPLNKSDLKDRLSYLTKEQQKGLIVGRLPMSCSVYLMGTSDPTGLVDYLIEMKFVLSCTSTHSPYIFNIRTFSTLPFVLNAK